MDRSLAGRRVPSAPDLGIGVATAVLVPLGAMLTEPVQDAPRSWSVWAVAAIAATGFSLAWRRVAPVAVLAVAVVTVAGSLVAGFPYGPVQLCMVVAMFEAARLRPLRVSLPCCVAAAGVTVVAILFRAVLHAQAPLLLATLWTSWLAVPWSVGALVRIRSAALARSRREVATRSALQERIRVAGEVHDVAGHGFSAVAMQAGVALVVLDDDPAQARASLEAIRATSTRALADLRAMLDTFHADRGPGSAVAPQRGDLADLPALVERVEAAGLPVVLTVDPGPLPDPIGRAAYRVVQESLTNVLRHAGPTTALVRVCRDGDELVVDVSDDGAGAPGFRPGVGLSVMRNRVAAAGGDLAFEAPEAGGFRVGARFPVPGGTP